MIWKVRLTDQARSMLSGITDQRVRRKLLDRMKDLAHDPHKQGKALVYELAGFRAVRAVGQRYRIIYSVEEDMVVVVVVALGMRKDGQTKDIYALARKLLRQGLLDPEE